MRMPGRSIRGSSRKWRITERMKTVWSMHTWCSGLWREWIKLFGLTILASFIGSSTSISVAAALGSNRRRYKTFNSLVDGSKFGKHAYLMRLNGKTLDILVAVGDGGEDLFGWLLSFWSYRVFLVSSTSKLIVMFLKKSFKHRSTVLKL